MVEPIRPQWEYKGAERQEWQRLHANDQRLSANERTVGASSSGSSSSSSLPIPTSASGESSAGVSSGRGGGGNVVAGAVGGLVGASSELGEKSAGLSFWVVRRLRPLKTLTKLGERLCAAGPKARLATAVPCALIGAGFALGHGGHDVALGLLGLALGSGIGWALPTLVGLALALAAMLTGLAIGLALIAAALGLIYVVVIAFVH